MNKSALEYVSKDEDVWEQDALKLLSAEKELKAFEHKGFWKAMDTSEDFGGAHIKTIPFAPVIRCRYVSSGKTAYSTKAAGKTSR